MKDISYLFALSPGDEDRLRVEAIVEHGKLENFVVQYEGKVESE